MGMLSQTGFTPTLVLHETIGPRKITLANLRNIDGRPVMSQASWQSLERFARIPVLPGTVTISEIPYVVLKP